MINLWPLYLLLSMVFLLFYIGRSSKFNVCVLYGCIFTIVAAYFFSIPSLILHGDASRYVGELMRIADLSFNEVITQFNEQGNWTYCFTLLAWLSGQIYADGTFFYCIIFLIFLYPFLKLIKEEFSSQDTLVLVFCYLLYPTFINYFTSGIRQGLGMVFMLYGIVKWSRDKRLAAFLLLSFSLLWHYGMLAPYLLLTPFLLLKNKARVYTVAIVMFVISFFIYIFCDSLVDMVGPYVGNYYAIYFDKQMGGMLLNTDYQSGVRLGFLAFSMIPMLVYFLLKKNIRKQDIDKCHFFIGVYMLLNAIYLCMSSMVYSDRFASFSWFIMPLVVYELCISTNFNNIKKYFIVLWLLLDFILFFYFYGRILFLGDA